MKDYSAEEIDVHKVTDTAKSLERKVPSNYVCNRCGQSATHLVDKCFALSIVCRKCNKKGHLAKVCRCKKQRVNELTETAIHGIASGKSQVTIASLARHPPTLPVNAAVTSSTTPPDTRHHLHRVPFPLYLSPLLKELPLQNLFQSPIFFMMLTI